MFGFERKPKPAQPQSGIAADDRRIAERFAAEQVPQMSAHLCTPGDIRLIDISATGARIETTRRLPPKSSVSFRLVTPKGTHVVPSRVVRSRVVRMVSGGLGCEVAIAFNEPLSDLLDDMVGGTNTASIALTASASTGSNQFTPADDRDQAREQVAPASDFLDSPFTRLDDPGVDMDTSGPTAALEALETQLRHSAYEVPPREAVAAQIRQALTQAQDPLTPTPAFHDSGRARAWVEPHSGPPPAAGSERVAAIEAELQQVLNTHAAEHASWNQIARQLESQLRVAHETIAAHAESEAAMQSQLQQAHESHAGERLAWEESRHQLELQIQTTQDALSAWSELETTLQTELRQIEEAHAAERAAWNDSRRAVERHAKALRDALDARDDAAARLTTVEADLSAALAARDAEARARETAHAEWQRERADLEARLREAREIASERHGLAETLGAIQSELGETLAILDREPAGHVIDRRESIALRPDDPTPRLAADAAAGELDQLIADIAASLREPTVVERVVVDTTAIDALEQRLRQARRLEEVGAVTVAMAPRLESLVTSLEAAAAAMHHRLNGSAGDQTETAGLASNAAQALALVRQLWRFGQKRARLPQAIDLHDTLERVAPMLRQLAGPDIDFNARLGHTGAIEADSSDVDQMFTSLVVSARDLLPLGGSMLVETDRASVGSAAGTDAPERAVRMSVRVSGHGVRVPHPLPALAALAGRCGGELRLASDAGQHSVLEIAFASPRAI